MTSVFEAVAHPTRRRILDLLRESDLPAGRIAEEFPTVTREAVSRHLRVLDASGLVTHRQEAQRRVYAVTPAPLAEVDQWLSRYRDFWSTRLDALEAAAGKRRSRR